MDWLTRILPGRNAEGVPILAVLGKRTYCFSNGKLAVIDEDEQLPFIETDAFYGEGDASNAAMRLESDSVAFKPLTDFAIIAKAHAPKGKQAFFLDVGAQVGAVRKILRVFGNRKAYVTGSGLAFSDAEPFSEMPLNDALAYGGKDEKSDPGIAYVYSKNPVGKGFVIKNHPQAIQDLVLPNIEDPQKLLTPQNIALGKYERWQEWPNPMGLGFRNKNSHPRFGLAGKALEQGNPSFYNGASEGFCFPNLKGGEIVKLAYLDPEFPQFSFTLPSEKPTAWLDVGEGPKEMDMTLQTVVVHKETNQVTMVWQSGAKYPGVKAMEEFDMMAFGVEG